jgi:hypothetical protein
VVKADSACGALLRLDDACRLLLKLDEVWAARATVADPGGRA